MRSRPADLAARGRLAGAPEHCAAWPDPSSRRPDLLRAAGIERPPEHVLVASGWSAGGPGRLAGVEGRAVGEHAVQDHGELAGERHPRVMARGQLLAFCIPARPATRIAQLFEVEPLTGRARITCAASQSAARTPASPSFEIRPVTSVSPDGYFFGVRPKCAPAALDDRNRPGSSIAAT